MQNHQVTRYTTILLATVVVVLIGTTLFEAGYYMGTKRMGGRGMLAVPGDQKITPAFGSLFMGDRRALTGVVKEINGDILVVQEDTSNEGQGYTFKKTPTTDVVRLVPNVAKKTKTNNTIASLFPFTITSTVFSDIKIDDRVYVLSSDPIPEGTHKQLPLLEVKIQPKQGA